MTSTPTRRQFGCLLAADLLGADQFARQARAAAADLPLFDARIHYSHDAWALVPPAQAVALLRQAGLRGAMVSSSDDQGTQMLLAEAAAVGLPGLIVPVLRPYRSRGEIGSWMRDDSVLRYLEAWLGQHRCAGIGEFHLYGEDADLPVPRRMVALARKHTLLLHAHSDIAAVDRLFDQWPDARVLWAHSGFDRPDVVRSLLRRHPRLWADLAFRGDHASGGTIDPAWRDAFAEFPDRFVLGSDTFTPERWHYIGEHARSSRAWLVDLPPALAERIAWRNAEALLRSAPPA